MASLNGRRTVEGVETEVIIQLFADSILVLVTQLGKVGSLVGTHASDACPAYSHHSRFRHLFRLLHDRMFPAMSRTEPQVDSWTCPSLPRRSN
jgi:hypothetical protein